MSKVNNITKCIIPCLNNILNEKLKHISNTWYLKLCYMKMDI